MTTLEPTFDGCSAITFPLPLEVPLHLSPGRCKCFIKTHDTRVALRESNTTGHWQLRFSVPVSGDRQQPQYARWDGARLTTGLMSYRATSAPASTWTFLRAPLLT